MAGQPNVAVIVLDSVRADRTSLDGHSRDTTPNLERIADAPDGLQFPTAIAHTRYTLPSSASILTGKYPGDHGVGFGTTMLESSVPTVPEALSDAGYRTELVSNNHFVGPETGLGRGFDRTTVLPKDPLGVLRTVGVVPFARWVGALSDHSAGFELDKYRHSLAYLLTQLVHKRLDALQDRDEPYFLYVHYNQPHRPYYPPLAWFDRYADAFEMSRSEAGDFVMEVHENLESFVARGCPFTDDEWATLRALYDAGIEYTDTFVGELYDRIQAVEDDTVVVATSDHGEHLGEHGALGHKYALDDALTRVPLVTAGLDVDDPTAPVQHTDVMCTILERGGADAGFVDGVDLRTETRRYAVSQDGERSLEPIYEVNPDFDPAQFFPTDASTLPQRTTIRSDTHRYVRGDDGTAVLYEPPDETMDRSEREPEVAAELEAVMDEWLASHRRIDPSAGADGDDLSSAVRQRLMKMGYMEEDL